MANECYVCDKQFSKHSNLRSHVKKFHPGLVNEIAPNKITKCAAVCNKCMKTFSKYSNLKQHVLKFHPDEIDKLTSSKVYLYPCEICQKNFSDVNHYKNHKKIHLGEENVDKRLRSLQCSLCDNKFITKMLLHKHFEQDHDKEILTKTLDFSTVNDFKCWKNNLEEKTHSRYVKQSGSYTTLESIKTVYVCQRSGFYVAKGSGKRHLKIQGSKKINGVCPSEMHVTEFKNGEHKVDFTETHIGHDNDLGHLNLTVEQRMEVAGKIATKIPFSCILDDIRDSVTNSKLERIHLLTKKDLHNITQTFNLNNDSVRHKDDVISIESWIHEVNESGTVIYYKPQSKSCNRHPNLKEEDFMLIIMHPGQLELLQKFSNDCICIDGTHGLNSYNFELTTLLVLDDMREGFPCSFLFSNRSDEDIMRIFFIEIREKIGRQIGPNVFMSDMAQYYYTAWLQEMLPPKVRLFCTWHVDRAWRKNLGKIADQEQKKTVYRQLRTLLQERDVVAFSNMLTNFVSLMQSSSETLEFANYFGQYYVKNVSSWAYCYRLGAGLNTNMHIERMHHTIKYLYLNGKHVKRLDKTINVLMKFVKDKLFERVITMNKGKISSKIKELRKRHKMSEELDISYIVESEMGWQIPSASTSEIYFIEERNLNCSCKLVCSFCAACLHSYSCTCLDNSIRWNMCKHIHLVCHYRKSIAEYPTPKSPADDGEIPLVIDDSKDEFIEENERLVQILSKPSTSISHKTEEQLIAEKQKLKMLHIGLIEKISSFEELETFKKITAPLVPTLSAIKNSNCENKILPAIKNLPHNKLICKQQRLFSTKKKTGKRDKNNHKLAKPTSKEADTTAVQLLNVNI